MNKQPCNSLHISSLVQPEKNNKTNLFDCVKQFEGSSEFDVSCSTVVNSEQTQFYNENIQQTQIYPPCINQIHDPFGEHIDENGKSPFCNRWNCLQHGHAVRNRRYIVWVKQLEKLHGDFYTWVVQLNKSCSNTELTKAWRIINNALTTWCKGAVTVCFPEFDGHSHHFHIGIVYLGKPQNVFAVPNFFSLLQILTQTITPFRGREVSSDQTIKTWLSYVCKTDPDGATPFIPPPGKRYKMVYGLKVPKDVIRAKKKKVT